MVGTTDPAPRRRHRADFTGFAAVGNTLTATDGSWDPPDATFVYSGCGGSPIDLLASARSSALRDAGRFRLVSTATCRDRVLFPRAD